MTVFSKLAVGLGTFGAIGGVSAVEVDAKTRVELKHPKTKSVTSVPLRANAR